MRDIALLLRRDWRLHRLTLLLPAAFCLLWAFIPYMILANAKPGQLEQIPVNLAVLALAPTAIMAGLRILGLHLIEVTQGTLPALGALPLRARDLVTARYAETLLLTLGLLVLVLLEGVFVRWLSGGSTPILPPVGTTLAVLGWCFVLGLALPLPIALRWDQKGLVNLAGLLFLTLLLAPLPGVGPFVRKVMSNLGPALHGLSGHPTGEWALLVALPLLGHHAATWALRRRDL